MLLPWATQGLYLVVVYNLLHMLRCHSSEVMEDASAGGDRVYDDSKVYLWLHPEQECWVGPHWPLAAAAAALLLTWQVRKTPYWPEVGSTSAFYSCVPTGMHGQLAYFGPT